MKKTRVLDDIDMIETFIERASNSLCMSHQFLKELEKDVKLATKDSGAISSTAKKSKLMPADVFPSAKMMDESFTLIVEVDLGTTNRVVEGEGYFVYDCGESFWCLNDSLDKPYKILAWIRK